MSDGKDSTVLKEHPEWLKINQRVQQKTIGGDADATKNYN